jgi:methionine-rich copper-binding protein CopC
MRHLLPIAILAACVLGRAPPVLAHAFLDHAAPAVGSTVHGAPAQLDLWFTQDLEPAFCTVRVLDSQRRRVDNGDAKVEATRLHVSLSPLAPGRYRVEWRVLSVDTHTTDGDFTFDVVP